MKRIILLVLMSLWLISTTVLAQGLDLNAHCINHGRARAVNVDGTVYGWRCEDSAGTRWDISIESACDEQWGQAYTAQFRDYNDPNSWYCQAPSNSQNPPPQTSTDRGCNISYFSVSPNGTVQLGTNVELYGESNCGTTKFTINGTSRAETGQPNNSETWRTNEWGTGTYNVCFLARGNGGWENADSRCQTVTVSSGQTSSPQSTPYTGSGSGTGTNTGTSGGSGIRNVDNGDDSSDYACDAYLPVEIGSRARLTAGLANRLRSQPTTQSAVLQSVPALTEFNVLSGPYCSGGHVWIEILLDSGDSGFTVAVSDSGENWVEPISNAGESHPNTIYVVEDSFDIYEGDALVLEADVSVTFDTFSNVVRIRTASINYSQGQTNLVNLVCLSRASIFIYDEDMELVHEERGPQRIQPLSLTTVSSEFAIAPFLRGDGTMYVEFWVMGQCVSDRTLFDLATRDPESALDRFEQRQDYNPSVDSITLTVRP